MISKPVFKQIQSAQKIPMNSTICSKVFGSKDVLFNFLFTQAMEIQNAGHVALKDLA